MIRQKADAVGFLFGSVCLGFFERAVRVMVISIGHVARFFTKPMMVAVGLLYSKQRSELWKILFH